MSLIGSTRDALQNVRKQSILQERRIDRNGEFAHWRKSDATRVSIVERGMALASIPVVFLWGLLLIVLSIGIGFSLLIFRILSRLAR